MEAGGKVLVLCAVKMLSGANPRSISLADCRRDTDGGGRNPAAALPYENVNAVLLALTDFASMRSRATGSVQDTPSSLGQRIAIVILCDRYVSQVLLLASLRHLNHESFKCGNEVVANFRIDIVVHLVSPVTW